MCSITVEVIPELQQLVFEIDSCPEQRAIQILPSNRSNQPLHERMRQGNIGHPQDSQIGLPLLKPIKRIVVGAEVLRHRSAASNGVVCKNTVVGDWRRGHFFSASDDPAWRTQFARFASVGRSSNDSRLHRSDQPVSECLMIPFPMIMNNELVNRLT